MFVSVEITNGDLFEQIVCPEKNAISYAIVHHMKMMYVYLDYSDKLRCTCLLSSNRRVFLSLAG